MKKIIMLSSLLITLSACSFSKTETLSCTYTNVNNGLTSNITYDIDHEGDEVKKIKIDTGKFLTIMVLPFISM